MAAQITQVSQVITTRNYSAVMSGNSVHVRDSGTAIVAMAEACFAMERTASRAMKSLEEMATTALASNTEVAIAALDNHRAQFKEMRKMFDHFLKASRETSNENRKRELEQELIIWQMIVELPHDALVRIAEQRTNILSQSIVVMKTNREKEIEWQKAAEQRAAGIESSRIEKIDRAWHSTKQISSSLDARVLCLNRLKNSVKVLGVGTACIKPRFCLLAGIIGYAAIQLIDFGLNYTQSEQQWVAVCKSTLERLKSDPEMDVDAAISRSIIHLNSAERKRCSERVPLFLSQRIKDL